MDPTAFSLPSLSTSSRLLWGLQHVSPPVLTGSATDHHSIAVDHFCKVLQAPPADTLYPFWSHCYAILHKQTEVSLGRILVSKPQIECVIMSCDLWSKYTDKFVEFGVSINTTMIIAFKHCSFAKPAVVSSMLRCHHKSKWGKKTKLWTCVLLPLLLLPLHLST